MLPIEPLGVNELTVTFPLISIECVCVGDATEAPVVLSPVLAAVPVNVGLLTVPLGV